MGNTGSSLARLPASGGIAKNMAVSVPTEIKTAHTGPSLRQAGRRHSVRGSGDAVALPSPQVSASPGGCAALRP